MGYFANADEAMGIDGFQYHYDSDGSYPFMIGYVDGEPAIIWGDETRTHSSISFPNWTKANGRVFRFAHVVALWHDIENLAGEIADGYELPVSEVETSLWDLLISEIEAKFDGTDISLWKLKVNGGLFEDQPDLLDYGSVDLSNVDSDAVERALNEHLLGPMQKRSKSVPNGVGSRRPHMLLWEPLLKVLSGSVDKPYVYVPNKRPPVVGPHVDAGIRPLLFATNTEDAVPVGSVAELNFHRTRNWGG